MSENYEVITYRQLMTAGRTVYAEARGEPEEGVLAVACVLWNRVRSPITWWGKTLEGVCLARWQFSCWNPETVGQPEDANYRAMKQANARQLEPYINAVLLAQHVTAYSGKGEWFEAGDPSLGACHYFNPAAVTRRPRWARGLTPAVVIGSHEFYVGVR